MDVKFIEVVAIGFIGILMIYLTRHVIKGKTSTALRLWFVSFCMYVVYYWLAGGIYLLSEVEVIFYALLWSIPAILSYWIVVKMAEKEGAMPFFRWWTPFLIALVFAVILDSIAGTAGWYTYNLTAISTGTFVSPIGGVTIPALLVLMLGVMMLGVIFLSEVVFYELKKKFGGTTATYILIGLSFIAGGLIWILTQAFVGLISRYA
ncbi:hypothetical protein [Methanocella arvoryzae]|uniref:Uncharacterized protein n=1 Tax=Methanocella arvoryzae (strain DSM 22066 / NBRC 105507 / MRE50) TaxID=351160 RepID=Q0W1N0_METAR|nr:hypothetical protein [Methanocella arvoryzae]CAJ37713.1 hypothetical protein RCIX2667 [Methanocella arvoryzae MRE50]